MNWGMIFILFCFVSFLASLAPGLLSVSVFQSNSYQAAINSIISLGVLVVFYADEFDLSAGSVFITCLVFFGFIHEISLLIALILVFSVAALIGCITGFFVNKFKASLFVTFVIMFSLQGISYQMTQGQYLSHRVELGSILHYIGRGHISGIPIVMIICFFIVIFLEIFFRYSMIGRNLLAIGINSSRAEILGINIQKYKLKVYIFSAIMAAAASIIYYSHFTAITPTSSNNLAFITLSIVIISNGGLQRLNPSPFRVMVTAFLLVLIEFYLSYMGLLVEAIYLITSILTILALFLGKWLYNKPCNGKVEQ